MAALLVALSTTGCVDGCLGGASIVADVNDLKVEGLDESMVMEVHAEEPFTLEARIMNADGTPATDYEWRWSTDSYGHTEETSHEEPNIERITITPTVTDQLWIHGEVGVRERKGEETISWRTIKGPPIGAWGGLADLLHVREDVIELAPGEKRSVAVYPLAMTVHQSGRGETLGISHEPVTLTSSDPEIVSVSPEGLLEARKGGQVTIEATVRSLKEVIEVTVNPELVMAPPLLSNPRSEAYPGGHGLVDDRGYPTVHLGELIKLDQEHFMTVAQLASWTGTGMGYEAVRRDDTRGLAALRMVRDRDDNVWIAYFNPEFGSPQAPSIAYRAMTDAPDSWTHRDLDLVELIDDPDLVSFSRSPHGGSLQVGLRARPDGGVWMVFRGLAQWRVEPGSEETETLQTIALANITTDEIKAQILVVQDPPMGLLAESAQDEEVFIRQSEDPEHPDILGLPIGEQPTLLQFDTRDSAWRPGTLVSPLYEPPNTSLTFSSLVQAIDPDHPERPSRMLMVLSANPSPGHENGQGHVVVLPEREPMVEPAQELPYDSFLRSGSAMLHKDSLYFTTGTPIYRWLMVEPSEVMARSTLSLFTLSDQLGASRGNAFSGPKQGPFHGWAMGQGVLYMKGFDRAAGIEFPEDPHPLLARDASSPQGRHLGFIMGTRPVAFEDGSLFVSENRYPVVSSSVATLDELDAPLNKSSPSSAAAFIDIRQVNGTLLGLTQNAAVHESVDRGMSWIFAGTLEEQPIDPWAMIDGDGNRHTLDYDRVTKTYAWKMYLPEQEEPARTKSLPLTTRNEYCGMGFRLDTGTEIGHTMVTQDGKLIRCSQYTGGLGQPVEFLIAGPDDDTWHTLTIGLNGAQNIDGNRSHPWPTQVVQLEDGRVLFGFTGLDPRTQHSRAMLVELQPDGTLSAPHIIKPDGGFAQQFRFMEPLPDGSVLVVWRDHGLPDIGPNTSPEPFVLRANAVGIDLELIGRVDELHPDEGLLDAWKEMGVTR